MKIAFVNDSCERLGVQCISSVLRKGGHETKLFVDPQLFNDVYIYFKSLSDFFDYKNKLLSDLKEYSPQLVGISTDTENYQWALSIARLIKKEIDVPIVFGGIHPTSIPERVIQNDCVDIVCVGEGEYSLLELADSMEKNGTPDTSIRNLWFKKGGQIVSNEIRPLINNLDELPFADKNLYYSVSPHFAKCYYVMASRGCPYECSYCCHSFLKNLYHRKGRYLRQRSVEHVITELEKAKKEYKAKIFSFCDDCFGFDVTWLRGFSKEYKKRISSKFICSMHPEHVTSESLLLLKEAGCGQITLGIQSWDENLRKSSLDRNVSNDVIIKAMRLIKESGIMLLADNIFGFPDQKEDDFFQSLLAFGDIKPQRIFFYELKYFPGFLITKKAKKNAFISHEEFEDILDGKYKRGVYLNSLLENKNLPNREPLEKKKISLYILDCFSKRILRFFIRKKLYNYSPSFINPAIFMLLRTLFSRDIDSKMLRTRMISHYSHYIFNKYFPGSNKRSVLH